MTLIIPRSQIGVPAPSATRPKLARPVGTLVVHYTGAGAYDNPRLDWEYAKSVARWAIQSARPYEYNYLIGLGGTVFEQGGDLRAAHCLNFNDRSIGVLMMVYRAAPSAEMIDSFRWLRWWLTSTGRLTSGHQVTPHYRFRDTQCCGPNLARPKGLKWASPTGQGNLGDVIPELLVPWMVAAPPSRPEVKPAPFIPEEDDPDMKLYRKNNRMSVWLADGKSRWHITSGERLEQIRPHYGDVLLLDESQDLNALGVAAGVDPGDV